MKNAGERYDGHGTEDQADADPGRHDHKRYVGIDRSVCFRCHEMAKRREHAIDRQSRYYGKRLEREN